MTIFTKLSRIAACLIVICGASSTNFAFDDSSESELLAILQSDAADAKKALACKKLAIHGSAAAVPELAKLLPNERLSSWSRIALEAIPGDASDEALRNAASSLEGRLLVGMINSIGVRRDAKAVDLLASKMKTGGEVTAAAAVALGRIGNETATTTLRSSLKSLPPGNLRSAAAEGCILCAERLYEGGNAKAASELYDEIRKADVPKQRIVEATRGAILSRGKDGLSLLMETLASDDRTLFRLALGTAREFPGDDVDNALAKAMASAAPNRAALIVQAMSDRADTVDLAVVFEAARTGDNVVRLSAIEALQRIGNESCLDGLLNIAVGSDEELATAAKETLAVLPGSGVDVRIGMMLQKAPKDRHKLLLQLVGQRRILSEVESVESALSNSDSAIRGAAYVALGEIVPLNKLSVLISQAVRPKYAADAAIAQQALKVASVRMPDREACAEQLSNALKRAPSSAKTTLLETLSAVGGKTALQTLAASAMDRDDRLQDTSSRLLGKWNGVEAAPVLLNLAKNAPAEKYRVRALRGYIGIARKFAMPEKQRAAMCESAVKATKRPTEHKLVLDVLKLRPSRDGLRLAVSMTKMPAVKNDASAASLVIAQKLTAKGADVSRLMAGIGLEKVKLEIISAVYGAGAKTKDVTAQVRKQAGDLPLISLSSGSYNASFGGDPAPGVVKQLKIKYRLNGRTGEASFAENALIILPTPKS